MSSHRAITRRADRPDAVTRGLQARVRNPRIRSSFKPPDDLCISRLKAREQPLSVLHSSCDRESVMMLIQTHSSRPCESVAGPEERKNEIPFLPDWQDQSEGYCDISGSVFIHPHASDHPRYLDALKLP